MKDLFEASDAVTKLRRELLCGSSDDEEFVDDDVQPFAEQHFLAALGALEQAAAHLHLAAMFHAREINKKF